MQVSKERLAPPKLSGMLPRVLVGFLVLLGVLIYQKEALASYVKDNIVLRTHIKSLGIGGVSRDVNFYALPLNLARNISSLINQLEAEAVSAERVILDVKFKEFSKLKKSRSRALQEGMIYHGHNSVKAKFKYLDDISRVDIGLKGYFLDHIATKKWSLKVGFKEGSFKGMPEISLQAPYTRDFQTAPTIAYAMRQKGVITPRDGYLRVTLNGQDMGLMYYEERIGEALTENSGVPYGPIFKFDEKADILSFVNKKDFLG